MVTTVAMMMPERGHRHGCCCSQSYWLRTGQRLLWHTTARTTTHRLPVAYSPPQQQQRQAQEEEEDNSRWMQTAMSSDGVGVGPLL